MSNTISELVLVWDMRISARCRYALQAVLEMSKVPAGTVLKVSDIAARPRIPADYLVQVLILLKTAGIVESVRGKQGGYRLAKPAGRITVGEVVEAVGGRSQAVEGLSASFVEVLRRAEEAAKSILEGTSFEDLVRTELEARTAVSYSI